MTHQPAQRAIDELAGMLTDKEASRLAKHFHDKEFMRLFEDYAKDISDPKTRAEQDQYLAQLEAQGELETVYGKGVQLIEPEPAFVVKTKSSDGHTRVYINVCTSSKVDKMTIEAVTEGPRKGLSMQLPCMVNPKPSSTMGAVDAVPMLSWDVTIHPEALERSQPAGNELLREQIIMSAIERVEAAGKLALLRKYKLPDTPYKAFNGQQKPSTLVQRAGSAGDTQGGHLRPIGTPLASTPAGAAAAAAASGSAAAASGIPAGTGTGAALDAERRSGNRGGRSSFSFLDKPPSSLAKPAPSSASAAAAGSGLCTPQHQVIERARVDLAHAWQDTGRGLQHDARLPEALVVRVDLPGVMSQASMQLDVAEDALMLAVPGKYELRLRLKYRVDVQQSTAKFNSSKQQLALTLPLATQPGSRQQAMQVSAAAGPADPLMPAPATAPASGGSAGATEQPGTVQELPAVCVEECERGCAAGEQPSQTAGNAQTDNQARWQLMHKDLDEQQTLSAHKAAPLEQQRQQQPAHAAALPCQAAAPVRQAVLQPRLLGRRVCEADFM